MTLLLTVTAAVISTLVWYTSAKARTLKIGTLALAYWSASIMWFVDAAAEYIELREKLFLPSLTDMINDAFLGFSVVALGLVVWIAAVLIKDPNNVLKKTFTKKEL